MEYQMRPFPTKRNAYLRRATARPVFRGRIMRLLLWPWPWWPLAVFTQFAITLRMSPHSPTILPRALNALASTSVVVVGDMYHNGDLYGYTLADEVHALRCDFVSISATISATFALWSAHFMWAPPYPQLFAVMVCATLLVVLIAFHLFETDPKFTSPLNPCGARVGPRTMLGSVLIKLILGAQFCLGLGLGMVGRELFTPCAPYVAIWFFDVPGFIAYCLNRPADGRWWGAHDVFHVFIVGGNAMSLLCDAVNLVVECAATDP